MTSDVRRKTLSKKRMIDAKEGKKVFSAIAQPAEYKGVLHMVVPISEIDKLPTADAVEVVHCRECKYRSKDGCPIIDANIWMDDDDFCSHGERKGCSD